MAVVDIRGKDNVKMKNQRIRLTFYKEPCGAEAKGEIKFEGETDGQGDFYSTLINYNLRNKNDKVIVEAVGPDIVVGGISPGNYEYVSFLYGDFIVGTVKQVDITLITNQ